MRESSSFRREFRPHQRFPAAPCRARFCGPAWLTVLVLESGIGRARTEATLEWLLAEPILENVPYRPKLVLSAGFAGALEDKHQIGDLLLATDVVDTDGNRWPTTWPGELPAGEWRPPLHRGRLLTTSHLVGNPEQKLELGRKHEAAAVDMESATVASWCSRKDVPFGCVRAISDRADTPLSPRLISLLSNSRVSPLRVLAALVRSPKLAGELWSLEKQTRLAAKQLGTALGELLTLTMPGGAGLVRRVHSGSHGGIH